MHRIKLGFETISPDMRVQAVLIGVVFVAILEGLTGFGAPMTIAAPLLVALGFRPLAAIVIGLIGDSTPVVFGAVGTPVVIGLGNVDTFGDPDFFGNISRAVTSVDFLVAVLLPLIAVTVLVKMFGENAHERSWREIYDVLPWALMVGLVYAMSAYLGAFVLSPELISIVAGLITLLVATITARYNILLRPDIDWRTHYDAAELETPDVRAMSILRAWTPYILVVVVLVATRLIPTVQTAVQQLADASWSTILGFETINSAWQTLYSPGSIMIVAALSALVLFRASFSDLSSSLKSTMQTVLTVSLALIPTLVMLQVFTNSGINTSGLVAMPLYIATTLADAFSQYWLMVAPILGALGAFIAGSSTVSALTMAEIQYAVAVSASLPTDIVLAQQLSGSAAGNMIAVHNIIAASAVVGVYHQEGNIIRRVLPVVVFYLILSVVSAYLVMMLGWL